MELARPGRFSSYSLTIAIIAFLTGKGVVKPLEEMISNEPKTDLKDEFCKKDWDYRLPATPPEIKWNCCSKQEAISTILSNFVEFSAWLASIEGILDTRSGKILSEENFLAKYEMSKEIFKLGGGLNIVDPFEIEHNTTNQITERSKFQIQKILKGVSIKAKMKRLVDYVSDVEKIANNDKDWGISLLIPSEVPQTTESPRKNNKPSEVTIKNNQIEDFCNFLKDVLRVKIHNFPSKTTASPQPEPKRSKQEQEVLPYTNNVIFEMPVRLECSTTEKLWEGRRTVRRKVERNYKNCSWQQIETQVSAILLASGKCLLPSPLNFTISTELDENENLHLLFDTGTKTQTFIELLRFIDQAGQKYFPLELGQSIANELH